MPRSARQGVLSIKSQLKRISSIMNMIFWRYTEIFDSEVTNPPDPMTNRASRCTLFGIVRNDRKVIRMPETFRFIEASVRWPIVGCEQFRLKTRRVLLVNPLIRKYVGIVGLFFPRSAFLLTTKQHAARNGLWTSLRQSFMLRESLIKLPSIDGVSHVKLFMEFMIGFGSETPIRAEKLQASLIATTNGIAIGIVLCRRMQTRRTCAVRS